MSLGLKKLIKEARDNGFNQQANQALYNYLGSLGVTGALNDRLYKYLVSRHGEGSLSSLLYKEGVDSQVQRFFTDFQDTRPSYITLDSALALDTSDFEIIADFATSSGVAVIGALSDTNSVVIDLEGTAVRAFARNGTTVTPIISTSNTSYLDGDFHRARLKYLGSQATLYLDGVEVGTQTWSLNGDQVIQTIGARPARPSFLQGKAANVKVIKNGVVVLDMPIDGNYTASSNQVLDISGNNFHGTFGNVAEGDSVLYTLDENSWVSGGDTINIDY